VDTSTIACRIVRRLSYPWCVSFEKRSIRLREEADRTSCVVCGDTRLPRLGPPVDEGRGFVPPACRFDTYRAHLDKAPFRVPFLL
jgi:hypothetical protein